MQRWSGGRSVAACASVGPGSPGVSGSLAEEIVIASARQRLDALRQPRNFPRGGVLVHDALLRGAGDQRLGVTQRGRGARRVFGRDRLLDSANESPHLASTRLVHRGPALYLSNGLLG